MLKVSRSLKGIIGFILKLLGLSFQSLVVWSSIINKNLSVLRYKRPKCIRSPGAGGKIQVARFFQGAGKTAITPTAYSNGPEY